MEISGGIAIIQLVTVTVKLNIIQVYAPTADRSDEEFEKFYQLLSTILKKVITSDIKIIMGDWNVKIGQKWPSDLVVSWGLGEANERGDRLYEFHRFPEMREVTL